MYCAECTQYLTDYGPFADIYSSLCEIFVEKWLNGDHLMMLDMPSGNLCLDFLERKGYIITHEIPETVGYFIVKPCGVSVRGNEFRICTCDCPARLRKRDQE
jgi:hypothetical protein